MATTTARTVTRRSPTGEWQNVARPPASSLRPYVHDYEGYGFAASAGVSRHVPPPYVPMILGFGGAMSMIGGRNVDERTPHQAFVAGMLDTWVDSTTDGASAGVQVNLTPIGAYMLLNAPMADLTGRVTHIGDVLGVDARDLPARLAEAPTWDHRMDIIDAMLEERLKRARPASPAIAWAWRQLVESGGNVSIGSLAERIGWSRKHFVNKFREHIGLPPKTAARVLRFNRVLRLLDRGTEATWASIAMSCGYYDQAHLIRDFNEFAGAPPLDYMSRLLPHGEYRVA